MNKNRISLEKTLLYITTSLVILMGCYLVYDRVARKDVAYIDVSKLVNSYKMKTDLEHSTSSGLYRIRNVIDSLSAVKKIRGGADSIVNNQLEHAQFAFDQYYEKINGEINKKIWERLNPVMLEYGKDRGLKLLLGATGTGNLLYANEGCDMTDDLIKYVNNKYEKGS